MTRQRFLLSLFGLAMRPFAPSASPGTLPTNDQPFPEGQSDKIEESARDLNVRDSRSFDQHVANVLAYPHVITLPDPYLKLASPRLSRGERDHMQSAHPGIHHDELVALFNEDVDALDAPSFAKVTRSQVVALRVMTVASNPIFMGRGFSHAKAKVGDSINQYMSPLQATHLGLVMADQKIANPLFQFEAIEWDTKFKAAVVASSVALSSSQNETTGRIAKAADLRERVRRRVDQFTPSGHLAMINRHLSAFGL